MNQHRFISPGFDFIQPLKLLPKNLLNLFLVNTIQLPQLL